MSLFISEAYAAGAPAPSEPSAIANMVMLGLFFVVFYFLIWRPQAKRQKEQKVLMEGLKKGDEVVFAGGLLGKIQKVDDEYAVVEINDKLTVKVQKAAVLTTLPAGTLKGIGAGSANNED